MEVKTHVHFAIDKDERKYVFSLPAGGTLGEAYDAAYQVLEKILEMSKEAADKAKPSEKDQPNADEKVASDS
jgi:hypothetical protein